MFKTKNLVHDVKDVPIPWVFEHFGNLSEKLCGQDIKIKSVFSNEKTPSLCIYIDSKTKVYKFKDFSSGKGGTCIDFVKDINNCSFHKACVKIVETYNDFILHNNGGYDVSEFKECTKYKVKQYQFRTWTTQDQYFWTQFNIGSNLLNRYCVKPLSSYTMEKISDGETKNLTISGNYIYGYFTKDGTLYKIYQPKTLDKKFIKINNYIQGSDQLEKHKFLIITSSLKDIMSLKSLKINADIVAPDSENTMISDDIMNDYLDNYEKIIVLFDNDAAGYKSMLEYIKNYPYLKMVTLLMSKDISDSIKDHGAKKVFYNLVPLLDKKLND
jgi:hypothetical protein